METKHLAHLSAALMVWTSKAEETRGWSFVLEEWKSAREHCERLEIADQAEIDLQDSSDDVVPP